ncbi:F-BAR domain only protein 2 isoform X1 [Pygocentrus nattereri]|uniref:F-BAR domain only protein 2 n=1 Tax=Pygocentrus nattereri TaxID=42514 RepID=A0A3B4CXX7_PYGNA|nr:F-BAR domain only protein 2 isoform X1 [Pygocentrus nattereri]
MITPYFLENFWGEKNNGFDVLYHNMKHGQISSKELSDFIRERATIEETYSRSMTKLAKSASNFSQLGTFAPVWDVFKVSTEKLAACHMELVRKLQELIKEVQKYVDEQAKAHKKTKEEVASTLEAVQNIQSVSQALQKSKENYNSKTLELERMRKEGATQRDLDKAGVKVKKATEVYKSYVEKYASTKTEFEQKMAETAQKFQDIEESHIQHMKEIIQSYSCSVEDTHKQIIEVHKEFVNNMENTSAAGLIQKLAESKGTGKERPGPIEFEECNVSIATEGAKPRKRKPFTIPGRRKDKDTDSTESTEVEATNTANGAPPDFYGAIDIQNANVPQVDEEGFCIRPEVNENDAKDNSFYSSSDSEEEDERRKFHVEIKPVQPNNGTHQHKATIDELKASIGNITLSPSATVHMRRNQSSDELGRSRTQQPSYNDRLANNDLLSLDPFGPSAGGSTSSGSSSAAPPAVGVVFQQEPSSPPADQPEAKEAFAGSVPPKLTSPLPPPSSSPPPFPALPSPPSTSPWDIPDEPFTSLLPALPRATSVPPTLPANLGDIISHKPPLSAPATGTDTLSSWTQSQWVAFNDDFVPFRGPSRLPPRPQSVPAPQLLSSQATDAFTKEESAPCQMEDHRAPPSAGHSQDVPPPNRPSTPLGTGTIVPPPRPSSRPKLPAGKLTGINEIGRPFSPPKVANSSPPPTAPLARAESSSSLSSNTSLSASNTPTVEDDVFVGKLPTFEKRCETPAGTSRGPSPVTLASQDPLPIAVAFTESVNAYFKGADPSKCIVKITGDMTLSFPSGIIKIFTSSPSPAVLSFKLRNTSKLEQILPNQHLLHSDSSQSDTNTKDFWLNMPALTAYLRKCSEQNPVSSYYNVDVLKYQVCSNGIQSTPLNLAVYWKCGSSTTDLRIDYRYNPEAMQPPGPLTSVQVLVPVNGGVTNMQSLPNAIWNTEQSKSLWKLNDISEKSENEGSGSLRAKFELSDGPSIPATLAVQFFNEGSTLSGVDMELVGSGYRLSLNKKRFTSGRYMADC